MFHPLGRRALAGGGLALLVLLAACGPEGAPPPTPMLPPNNGGAPTVTTVRIVPTPAPVTPLPRSWQGPFLPTAHIRSVIQAPDTGSVVYASGDGVYRSTDGGQTWQTLTADFMATEVQVAPANPQIMYAGTGEGCASGAPGNLHRSTDGGATWTALPAGPFQLNVDPANPDHLRGLRCDGVYESVDGGQTWKALPGATTGMQNRDPHFLVSGVNDWNYIYALFVAEGGSPAIQRSSDGGKTWQTASAETLQAPVSLSVYATDARHPYYVGANGFFSSADAGAKWNAHNNGLYSKDGSYLLTSLAQDTVSPAPAASSATLYLGSYQGGDTKPFAGMVFRWNGNNAWVPVVALPPGAGVTQLLAVNTPNNAALLAFDPQAGIYRITLH